MDFSHLLFIDIETVAQRASYEELSPAWQALWDKKAQEYLRDAADDTPSSVYPKAAFHAEFGKIVCISCGYITGEGGDRKLKIKSFYGHDEKALLQEFAEMICKWHKGGKLLCAHNGKSFDYPFICRRLVIHGIPLPECLQLAGLKPWNVKHLDTLDLWKFGGNNYVSLNLIAQALCIPSPKDDIDGSMVYDVYWKENNLKRIVTYCQKDVLTLVQTFLRFNGQPLVSDGNVEMEDVTVADPTVQDVNVTVI